MTENINTQLRKKYDIKFNFFFAKPISEIVYNHTYAMPTLNFKDIVVYSQSNQYLKRTYHIKNTAGRNQIYDRINMLADFYCGATMLKYQYPMMIISKTKDIFLKRNKRMKKMIASDCSSQQSSQFKSQHSSQAQSFSSSRFLRSVKTNQLSQSDKDQDSLIKNCKKSQKSFDQSLHDIFGPKTLDFIHQSNKKQESKLSQKKSKKIEQERQSQQKILQTKVSHLIIEIDDIDKQRALKQYIKVQERQNLQSSLNIEQMQKQIQINMNKNRMNRKKDILKKSSIIITPIDSYPPGDKQSESSGAYNYYPKNSKQQNQKKHPNRYREEYDQTIRVNNNYNNLANNINYNSRHPRPPAFRSPSFGPAHQLQGNSTERNKNFGSPSRMFGVPRLDFQGGQQPKTNFRERMYTTNSNLSPSSISNNPSQYKFKKLPTPDLQYQTIYLTPQEKSISQISSKANKKQIIREKAVALLKKVKSEQKLPIYYDANTKKVLKYAGKNKADIYE